MHSMMVVAHLESNEAESAEFYNTLAATKTKSENIGAIHIGENKYVETEVYGDVLTVIISMRCPRNDGHPYMTRRIQRK